MTDEHQEIQDGECQMLDEDLAEEVEQTEAVEQAEIADAEELADETEQA